MAAIVNCFYRQREGTSDQMVPGQLYDPLEAGSNVTSGAGICKR